MTQQASTIFLYMILRKPTRLHLDKTIYIVPLFVELDFYAPFKFYSDSCLNLKLSLLASATFCSVCRRSSNNFTFTLTQNCSFRRERRRQRKINRSSNAARIAAPPRIPMIQASFLRFRDFLAEFGSPAGHLDDVKLRQEISMRLPTTALNRTTTALAGISPKSCNWFS